MFSGIGGFSRGLRFVGDTVAFCDMAPESCAVLTSNEELKGVPVLPDVTRIDRQQLERLRPNAITAGFPCQDISSMLMTKDGQVKAGLDGPRSKLFFEIPRLIKQSKGGIRHALLENSPCIVGRDTDRVIEELQKVGMHHIAFGVFAASDVGALHRRRRWFLLASSRPDELPLMSKAQLERALAHTWVRDDVPRVIPRPVALEERQAILARLSLMGNSVVPQAVAFAYQNLATALRQAPRTPSQLADLRHHRHVPLSGGVVVVVSKKQKKQKKNKKKDEAGDDDGSGDLEEQRRMLPRPDLSVVPKRNVPIQLVMKDNRGRSPRRRLTQWMTPRRSVWNQNRGLNERAMWDLANGIYYEVNTLRQCPAARGDVNRMSDVCSINPNFVENLMGYPLDWTKTALGIPSACEEHAHLSRQERKRAREENKALMAHQTAQMNADEAAVSYDRSAKAAVV